MKWKSCLSFSLLTTMGLLCVGILVVGVVFWIPANVEDTYGPSNEVIDPLQSIILANRLFFQSDQLQVPQDAQGASTQFSISLGEPTMMITDRLESVGLIPDASAMRDYLLYTGIDTKLQAGDFTLSARMTPIEIIHNLLDATPEEVNFRILPGWRMEEIAEALPTSGLEISPQQFLTSAQSPNWHTTLGFEIPSNASLEGMLFPDSYRLQREISTETFIATILRNFQNKLSFEIRQGLEAQDLGLHEGIILASIVEREAIVEDEMPIIASVFHNRLAAGIKLDSDPTVQYGLGYNPEQHTWWTNPLSLVDLEVDSPYNTYRYGSLPPGPIANPSLNALRAVAFPANTPYYYFRAACDGSGRHAFAETFEEHKNNACP